MLEPPGPPRPVPSDLILSLANFLVSYLADFLVSYLADFPVSYLADSLVSHLLDLESQAHLVIKPSSPCSSTSVPRFNRPLPLM